MTVKELLSKAEDYLAELRHDVYEIAVDYKLGNSSITEEEMNMIMVDLTARQHFMVTLYELAEEEYEND